MQKQLNKILIVDDERFIRMALMEALSTWGYQSSEAATIAQARKLFAADESVVVLLDIDLPDGSGLDFLEEVKKQNSETIVIMITGNVDVENTIAALRGGAHDFICKPVRLEEIRGALGRWSSGRARSEVEVGVEHPHLGNVVDR